MTAVAEDAICSTRIMENFKGEVIKSATFSSPIRLVGFDKMPRIGSEFKSFLKKSEAEEYAKEWKEGQTEEQFMYSTRKKGFGPLKKKWWNLPPDVKGPIMKELEDRFGLLFDKLKVGNTKEIVSRTVKPMNVKKEIPELLGKEL